jgi:hypothetical protein
MKDLIDHHLEKWIKNKRGKDALIAVFNHIRDIPYRVLPELNHPQDYRHILKINAGSCTPKHLLMAEVYQRLGQDVLLVVYPYRWDEFENLYPLDLRELARIMPPVYHLACKVCIKGRYTLVDATIDPPLGIIGLPVNVSWDGETDTALPIVPTQEAEIYHPSEALLMPPPQLDEIARTFYNGLNDYFDRVRSGDL